MAANQNQTGKKQKDVLFHQSRLNMNFFTIWLMVTMTIQWITLDMYLPALPVLKAEFHTTEAFLNLSLNTDIVGTAVGTLISGSLSDKYGRKSMAFLGFLLSAGFSFASGAAGNILVLSLMRGIMGLGTGFLITIITAMMKDSFTGTRFERNITTLQAVAVIGPIIAPSLGSLLINSFSWRFIFLFLGTASVITMIPLFFADETWPKEKRTAVSLKLVLIETASVAKDKGFTLLLAVMGLLTIPVWAYVSVSSYVYITDFGLSNLEYGLFYALGSVMSFAGPFLYILLKRKLKQRKIITICLLLMLAGGIMLLTIGAFRPVLFLLSVIPVLISEGMIRPLGTVVLLERHEDATGAASSLIQFIVNLVGIIGTSLATMAWLPQVFRVGVIVTACAVAGFICWWLIRSRKMIAALND